LFLAGIFLSAITFVGGQKTPVENKAFEKKDLKITNAERSEFV
jgi:hypothetical protein